MLVDKYLDLMLSELPPKQAVRRRADILRNLELLYLEAQLEVQQRKFEQLESLLKLVLDANKPAEVNVAEAGTAQQN